MKDEEVSRGLEAWKVTIQVQQHFNDIEMRIRNYALTLLLAVSAAAGVALRENRPELALGILLAGLIVWSAFYFMDEWWYHRLLIGAVTHALDLEKQLSESVPGIGLSGTIKDASAVAIGKRGRTIRSSQKIRLFYGVIAVLILVAMFAIAAFDLGDDAGNPAPKRTKTPPQSVSRPHKFPDP